MAKKTSKRTEARNRYLLRTVAKQRGWNVSHVAKGGNFLEEQEIEDAFPDIGLNGTKPDFLVCAKGITLVVVECKNEYNKIDEAMSQARNYAEQINSSHNPYQISIIVGSAGEEDYGYVFRTEYLLGSGQSGENIWVSLEANGYPITSFPSYSECENALLTTNGATELSIPKSEDFISAAISISAVLRSAKIEPQLRPKVLGSLITALYWGDIDLSEGKELDSINALVSEAITTTDHFSEEKKGQLITALTLTQADYKMLAPKIAHLVALLNTLNIRSVLQTDTDFLGMLYEAFIRYGYDNNALGIVFTPRHITKYCAELIDVQAGEKVLDLACGSGGFLVAAFDRMMRTRKKNNIPIDIIRESLYGFDTNPTVWSLAALNMVFRGDGKSHIENSSCFEDGSRTLVRGRFNKVMLNPPFTQEDEPERDFISAGIDALEPKGLLAVVVKSGIFADRDNSSWRTELLKSNVLLGMISLPGDLFYPTAVDTTIMVLKAHCPHRKEDRVFMAKIWNDGYEKLKGKRVECSGNQLPEVLDCFNAFMQGKDFTSDLATVVDGSLILQEGAEFSPEQYLSQPSFLTVELSVIRRHVEREMLSTCIEYSDLSSEVIDGFPCKWNDLPSLPYDVSLPIEELFYVGSGKSQGEKNYQDGACPYISSGDPNNSIVRLVQGVDDEIYCDGGITVTCFGCARVQPWPFMARGNGGSAVRVLTPKYRMTLNELIWFASQINSQRWRFFYGRMSIKGRLKQLTVKTPTEAIPDSDVSIAEKVSTLRKSFEDILGL